MRGINISNVVNEWDMSLNGVDLSNQPKTEQDKLQDEFIKKQLRRFSQYQLNKKCLICNTPISDHNKSGYCSKCKIKPLKPKGIGERHLGLESKNHNDLKNIAYQFLKKHGFVEIHLEYYIGQRGMGHANDSIKADVAGIKQRRTWIVECGGSTNRKLKLALQLVDRVYILPHGETEPYLFSIDDLPICPSCGHSIAIKKHQPPK